MPDFSLLQTPNFAAAALSGFQAGQAQRRDADRQGALRSYLENPEDEVAITNLAANSPELGMPLMQQRQKRAREAEIGDLAYRAQQGDMEAAHQLWQLDPDLGSKLSDDHRKLIDTGTKAIGNAAYRIALLPEDQRAAAWDQAVEALSPQFPNLAQYKGQYSDANLNSILDQTGMTDKLIDARQPKYQVGPPGGMLMQTNPLAGSVGAARAQPGGGDQSGGVPAPKSRTEYESLPPGTQYMAPDGTLKVKGGPTPSASGGFR